MTNEKKPEESPEKKQDELSDEELEKASGGMINLGGVKVGGSAGGVFEEDDDIRIP